MEGCFCWIAGQASWDCKVSHPNTRRLKPSTSRGSLSSLAPGPGPLRHAHVRELRGGEEALPTRLPAPMCPQGGSVLRSCCARRPHWFIVAVSDGSGCRRLQRQSRRRTQNVCRQWRWWFIQRLYAQVSRDSESYRCASIIVARTHTHILTPQARLIFTPQLTSIPAEAAAAAVAAVGGVVTRTRL